MRPSKKSLCALFVSCFDVSNKLQDQSPRSKPKINKIKAWHLAKDQSWHPEEENSKIKAWHLAKKIKAWHLAKDQSWHPEEENITPERFFRKIYTRDVIYSEGSTMGRKRRLHIPGGICHITQQCHWKSHAFSKESVKQTYLALGYEIARADQVEIISFSLQDSHPHWVLKMPEKQEYTVSQFMHKLNIRFGKWFNRTGHRKGTFWAGRFSCTWVESGSLHFFELTRYVDRNPLERQSNPIKPEDYRWGSFHYLFQPDCPYPVTFLRYLYQAHPDKSETEAWQWYQALVSEAELNAQKRQGFFRRFGSLLFLGSERFEQKGKELYRVSLENLQIRGLSWIQMVRDYSQLFRPLLQSAPSG